MKKGALAVPPKAGTQTHVFRNKCFRTSKTQKSNQLCGLVLGKGLSSATLGHNIASVLLPGSSILLIHPHSYILFLFHVFSKLDEMAH